ncbi:hypothetical protein IAR50_001330 [Cryptococcus sp. DSM 104548]
MDSATQAAVLDAIYSLSIPIILPIPILLILSYTILAPHFVTERQRAYILSAITSGTMTLASLPFAWSYLRWGLEVTYKETQQGWMAALARIGVVFFGTYLLSIGYFKYRNQIGLLTGWVHHTVYIGLMVYLMNSRHSSVFMAGCVMELPTFELAISNLFPPIRNDLRFLLSFFAFRIAYHGTLLFDCLLPSLRKSVLNGSWVPAITLALALVLHVSWFKGGVTGYLRRRELLREGIKPSFSQVSAQKVVGGVAPAAWPESPPPETPEDTPLVTPHSTPSHSPNIFSALPHSSIPGQSTSYLPTVAIPAISVISGLSPSELRAAMDNKEERGLKFEELSELSGEKRKESFQVERDQTQAGSNSEGADPKE